MMVYGTDESTQEWADEDGELHDGAEGTVLSRVRSGQWLDAQEFPPLRWAVQGVVPEGFGLLVAPPKAGKSWWALGVALAAAAGGQALGCIPVDQRPVLYLALEDGYRRLQTRCRYLLGDDPIPGALEVVINATPPEVRQIIAEWLELHRDEAPLVLLDTLGKVMPPTRAGETPYARDYRVCGDLKSLADAVPGCTVLAIHHTRKMQGEDFVDAVSGTQGIAGAADFVLVLSRRCQESDAALAVTGRDVVESEYAMSTDAGRWTLTGADLAEAAQAAETLRSTSGLGDRSTAVVEFVVKRPNGTRATDVATHLGIDNNQAGIYLRRAEESGRIAKSTRGVYTPPVLSVLSVSSAVLNVVTSNTPNTPNRGGTDHEPLNFGNWRASGKPVVTT